MIRFIGFDPTDIDIRNVAFPKVGVPDEPDLVIRGITRDSLSRPISNFRDYLRSRWNASRCDVPTFLGLRCPEWASESVLALVAAYNGPSIAPDRECEVILEVIEAQAVLLKALREWRRGE